MSRRQHPGTVQNSSSSSVSSNITSGCSTMSSLLVSSVSISLVWFLLQLFGCVRLRGCRVVVVCQHSVSSCSIGPHVIVNHFSIHSPGFSCISIHSFIHSVSSVIRCAAVLGPRFIHLLFRFSGGHRGIHSRSKYVVPWGTRGGQAICHDVSFSCFCSSSRLVGVDWCRFSSIVVCIIL